MAERVYIGYDDWCHTDVTCEYLDGPAERLKKAPLSKALKWDYDFCPRCFE